jgi:RNA polymerase sigma-70 factor (ECF subfamily)
VPDDPYKTRLSLLRRIGGLGPEAADGDREGAWREFDEVYRSRITAFARKMGATGGEADDVVQDVITGFYHAVGGSFRYDPSQSFRGYLYRSTRNALIRRRRTEGRQPRTVAKGDAADVLPDAVAAEQAWNDIWQLDQLRRAVERVREHYVSSPEADLRTFNAFYRTLLDERDTAEVAEELQMSEASVRKARERVKDRVRKALDEVRTEETWPADASEAGRK